MRSHVDRDLFHRLKGGVSPSLSYDAADEFRKARAGGYGTGRAERAAGDALRSALYAQAAGAGPGALTEAAQGTPPPAQAAGAGPVAPAEAAHGTPQPARAVGTFSSSVPARMGQHTRVPNGFFDAVCRVGRAPAIRCAAIFGALALWFLFMRSSG